MTQTGYRSNNDHTVNTVNGEFMLVQRNAGYADNDGQWVVTQLPELFWSNIGTLRRRRASLFLGVFPDLDAAMAAVDVADRRPEIDEPVTSMGRSSS